ncbi:MAG: hypothetical protein RR585_01915 [Coprobacillus sp.]
MLKLIISASLLQATSNAISAIAGAAAIQEKEHPFLIAKEKKSLERQAKMFGMTVEEIIKDRERHAATNPKKSFIEKLPLISNIKAYSDKVFNITRNDKDVTIEVNEDFIKEALELGKTVAVNALVPALDLAAVIAKYAEGVDAYKEKWETKDKEDVVIDSTEIAAEQVPAEIKEKVTGPFESNGWTLVIDENPSTPTPFFTDEEKENYILCVDLLCTRGEEKFSCFPGSGASILENVKEKTVPQLAERQNMPSSLIKAICAYYGVEIPAPKVEETTAVENKSAE